MRRLTTEEWVAKAEAKHGKTFDYTKVNYQGAEQQITVVCKQHGDFNIFPPSHLRGKGGCKQCRSIDLSKRFSLTNKEFVQKANAVHRDYYDYSKVTYVNQYTDVIIICPKHGEFPQSPNNHFAGKGCSKCGWKKRADKLRGSKDKFVADARKVHREKYDYSGVVYQTTHDPVAVKCPKHGVFYISPSSHVSQKSGCRKCGYESMAEKQSLTTDEFINKARGVHGEFYDYSFVDYYNSKTRVTVVCPKHGVFEPLPHNHLEGKKCDRCQRELQGERQRSTTEEFIAKAESIHGERYDYDEVDYQTASIEVTIVCRKHGPFGLTPNNHLGGTGCAACTESKGEVRIAELLDASKRLYHRQWSHPECVYVSKLRFDFFVPDCNLLIEYDGHQHFKAIDLFGGEDALAETQRRDGIKNKFAMEYGYRLLRIPYWDFNDIEMILSEAGV